MKVVTKILAIISTMVFILSAQVPVKKDLMPILKQIPPPPMTVQDAFAKVTTRDNSGSVLCSAEKLFQPIEQEVKEVEEEFKAQPKPGAGSAIPGLSPENAKKLDDPEMKKKMKTMSKEEKMKMAMEMMKSVPPGSTVPEIDPPLIRAALNEWQKIYNDTQNEFQRSAAEQQQEAALDEEYKKSHAKIDLWERAEIDKLPQISSGEMSAPDPAKVKVIKLESSEKHIAVANKRLEQIRSQWRASIDHAITKYTVFYQKLIAAEYAAASKNFSTKKVLADAQITILVYIGGQIKLSRNAWEESAAWHVRRRSIENQ
jgi:hypothetical protein